MPVYKINNEEIPAELKCATVTDTGVCGHTIAVHGSNGYICCRCDCKKFSTAP